MPPQTGNTTGNKTRIFAVLLILFVSGIAYFGYTDYRLMKNKSALETELTETRAELASTTRNLEGAIGLFKQNLASTTLERNGLEQNLLDQKTQVETLVEQIQGLSDTVGTLQKLHKTDPELLKKYSKVYFLNENYIPPRLTKIDEKYTHDPKKEELIFTDVWPFLQTLLDDAAREGADLKIISGYRSFGQQAALKFSYTVTYGSGANKFSADQGYSEHQLGTAIDFTTQKTGASFELFEKTSSYKWLAQNAYKYGFIISYPENNSYYKFEPWHWRFVGRQLAGKLHIENKNFYDLDQRLLDTYLISFFD